MIRDTLLLLACVLLALVAYDGLQSVQRDIQSIAARLAR